MKKDGKYRFSLQFGADSEEQVRAGELLERLGNKKSTIVVAALSEYISAHPELLERDCKIEVKLSPHYSQDKIEQLIRKMVEDRLAALPPSMGMPDAAGKESSSPLEEDIAQMLDNLDLFG